MIKWIHHLLNPHCPECRAEREMKRNEELYCESCENFKTEIARLREDNERLLNRIIEPKQETKEPVRLEGTTPIFPRTMPWRVRQQMLEKEDKARAQAMRNAAKSDKDLTVEAIEKEMGIVEKERENVSGTSS